jgi:predicted MPP superfamily phosphohydrolase
MSRFRRLVLGITAVCHLPFVAGFAEAVHRLGAAPLAAWASALFASGVGVYLFLGRAEKIANDEPRSFRETFFFDVPYYVHWCACVFCLVPSIVYLVGLPIAALLFGTPIAPAPGFFMWTYALGLIVSLYGVTIRRWWFVTRRVEIGVKNLDPRLDGYRIVQLSDLHVGALTPPWWAKRWIARANEEQADAVVVTGDLVTSGIAFHDAIADLIGGLKGADGVFCSMGNHDYFGEGEPLISLIRARGPRVLRNEGLAIERNGASFYLAAIDDTWTKRADIDLALRERPEGMPTIVLSHDPDRFPHFAARSVDLVLSGHTHGGQIAVPFLARHVNASKLAHRFHLGLYEKGPAKLYVHPGLGTTGPPIRLGVAPAIVVLTLRAA